MGNALLNFRELAQLEEREPKVVEMIDRFEATQSDFIKDSILSSLSYMRLLGDVVQLYFPTMLDIAVAGMSDNTQSSSIVIPKTENKPAKMDKQTPDLGGKEPPSPIVPGANGPKQV